MFNSWSAELRRLFLLLTVAVLLGLPFDHPWFMAIMVLAGYLSWHLYNLYRLYAWLNDGHRFHPPEASGIWGDVFHLLYRLQLRNRKRKRRLTGLIKRFQEATAAMPDATVILDADGTIEWFNSAAQQLLGLQPGKDVGQRIVNLLRHPQFTRLLSKGANSEPLRIPAPDDDCVTLNLRIVPYGREQRLLIARDVSQQQRLEQMRRDFVANVSHELRTPLTVMSGFLETLLEDEQEYAPHLARSLGLMQQQASRMQHIVEDLLLLSRLETERSVPPHEVVPVTTVLGVIEKGIMPLAEQKQQSLSFDCGKELSIYGAEKELYSAFSNLIANAVRYTPEGGTIQVRWYRDAGGAHFEVQDSGMGIAPEHIPRLTERFYRVDVGRSKASGGTGLGLAIVKHVVNRHNGALRISSTLRKGSTFSIDFPGSLIVSEE
ncbi:MAG: phosphate regulon sensor histidine kinase PhoR [Gammaproteobacteria bacterium]|nr:phosphate regulon sensor histidine kinase PhoR [Gammaproteobacteria bacterium]MCW8971681.1 phosphate regulon sensor histidine kinase PhoR [Gammaproteobacteria bacterium]MCW8993414.1 phosphate regulon sensor histidine kinase PhoR [Gammaproteobacteria bacterium]